MFHGLTVVNFDGQIQNVLLVNHAQPWSDGHIVTGVIVHINHLMLLLVNEPDS